MHKIPFTSSVVVWLNSLRVDMERIFRHNPLLQFNLARVDLMLLIVGLSIIGACLVLPNKAVFLADVESVLHQGLT